MLEDCIKPSSALSSQLLLVLCMRNACASLHIIKTEYDTEVEYMEGDQNVSLPFIQLIMSLDRECSSSLVQGGCYGNCFNYQIFV